MCWYCIIDADVINFVVASKGKIKFKALKKQNSKNS